MQFLCKKKLIFFSSISQIITKLRKELLYMLRNQTQNQEMCISDENCDFSPASPLKNCKFFVNIFFSFSLFCACCPLAFRRNVCYLHCKRPILASVFPSSWVQWAQCTDFCLISICTADMFWRKIFAYAFLCFNLMQETCCYGGPKRHILQCVPNIILLKKEK